MADPNNEQNDSAKTIDFETINFESMNNKSDAELSDYLTILKADGKIDANTTVAQLRESLNQEINKKELVTAIRHIAYPSIWCAIQYINRRSVAADTYKRELVRRIKANNFHGVVGSSFDININGQQDKFNVVVKPFGKDYDPRTELDKVVKYLKPEEFRKVTDTILKLLDYVYIKYTEFYSENKDLLNKVLNQERDGAMLFDSTKFCLLFNPDWDFRIGGFIVLDSDPNKDRALDIDVW